MTIRLMKIRRILMTTLALAMAVALPVQAKTFKIATISPDGLAWMTKLRAGAEEIEKRTDGRVRFKIYPGGVQGDDFTVLRKMRIGQLHGGAVSSSSLTRFYPDLQVYGLPLVFNDFDEVDYVRERMDQRIIDGLWKNGIKSFALTETGFAYLQTDTPVTSLAELQKKDTWVPSGDPISADLIKSFGISPIPLYITDVLAGLQTGLVDAVTVPPLVALALQWHNHVNYMIDMPLLYTYSMLMLDRKAFESISAADQAVVTQVMNRVFQDIDANNRKDNRNAFDALVNQGIKLTDPSEAEVRRWKAKAEVAINELVDAGEISRESVDMLEGHLATYRAAPATTEHAADTDRAAAEGATADGE